MKRIAIVNRGEAAGRCIRAIKELRLREGSDLAVIALYTEPDRGSPFVRQADVALSIGSALRTTRDGRTRPAYLDRARLLAALRATRADAVWPGWGFVAEDPEFVAALEERKIIFIGPPSAAMRVLGDKIAAKHLAEDAGVPVARWSGGPVGSDAAAAAAQLGYPLMIKASAGGGGRGIRLVDDAANFEPALASARAEASHAFGDDAVYLEAAVDRPRHIEVQIAADAHGNVVSFGLRDCSVQRRHQKVLEESPPANLAADLTKAIESAALDLTRRAGYRGLGTAEFLVDRDGKSFYFLEVNPRLQVEHGVTEAVTGCDLVVLQIRIARGEAITGTQRPRGHAIEVRICAEDPQADFAPAPGRVALLDLPTGPGIRCDCGASTGTTIPAEFDSLVAKLIAHAPSRDEAIARLRAALGDLRLVIAGGSTNKGFLLNLLEHPDVADLRRGGVDIGWLDSEIAGLTAPRFAPEALIVAAILTYLRERAMQRLNFFAEVARGEPQSIPPTEGQVVDLGLRGNTYRFHVLGLGSWRYRIDLGDTSCTAELLDREELACQLAIGEEHHRVEYSADPSTLQIEVNGHRHTVGRDRGGEVRAAAPSVVVAFQVGTGDRVTTGQQIGVLETMKIEIALNSPISGTVREIRAAASQRVAAGDILLIIQPDSADDAQSATRIALPDSRGGAADSYDELFGEDRYDREKVRHDIAALTRRLQLGYDTEPEQIGALQEFFDSPLPADLDRTIVRELGEIHTAVKIFADIEVLFSRQLGPGSDGTPAMSNDAMLHRYLRRVEAEGAGLDADFLRLLRRGLTHYKVDGLQPCEHLQRALLRIYAARKQRADRYRVVEALLRHLGRLAQAGLEMASDTALADALTTCIVLRGEVPDALADAAFEVRAAFFEAPEVARRTQLAERALAAALAEIDMRPDTAGSREIVESLGDSAEPIFQAIIDGARLGNYSYSMLALQALALRLYAPTRLSNCVAIISKSTAMAKLELDDNRSLVVAILHGDGIRQAWPSICQAADEAAPGATLEVFLLTDEPPNAAALRAVGEGLLGDRRPSAKRVTFTAPHPSAAETSASFGAAGSALDTHGLHPETLRRIGIGRLQSFDIERLDAPYPLYSFFGQSRSRPRDQRLFVYGEVHAAVPGYAGTLHEASFVRVFAAATRCLRRIRNENPGWRRLHWNRIVIRVRPSFDLAPETLQRLMDELLPATRHLGLDRIIVQLSLRDSSAGDSDTQRELVIQPMGASAPQVTWRTPHGAPLEPADEHARRVAAARRRGLVYPYDAIQMLCSGAHEGDEFLEYDLDSSRVAVPVPDRAPSQNSAGIVFGLATAHTAKVPEGIRRVTILSDPTREMGAFTREETDRIIAALDLAERERIPVEWFATSSGARISMDSGTENLDSVATVVRRIVHFTQRGGEINVIVTGTNVGAQSYFDALATMLMHCRGILVMTQSSSMVLTGKRALDASGSVSADDERTIGGFEDIMGPNGQAQYYTPTVDGAFELLMQHYDLTYVVPGEARPRSFATADHCDRGITGEPCRAEDWQDAPEGATVGDYLADDANPGRKKPFSIRPVMRALIDRDRDYLERWSAMHGAATAVVWDSHLGGYPICLIGIENRALPRDGHGPPDGPAEWTGATLFPASSKKVARALNSASGNRPAVILANLAGFDGSPESMRNLQLEYGAEIARAVVNFRGPILFVVTSRYHGGAYVVFSTRLNDEMHAIALRGSYASVIGGGPAATVIFSEQIKQRTERDPRIVALRQQVGAAPSHFEKAALQSRLASLQSEARAEHQAAIAAEFDRVHSVERAQQVGSLHEIIAADELRPRLIEQLDRWAASLPVDSPRS